MKVLNTIALVISGTLLFFAGYLVAKSPSVELGPVITLSVAPPGEPARLKPRSGSRKITKAAKPEQPQQPSVTTPVHPSPVVPKIAPKPAASKIVPKITKSKNTTAASTPSDVTKPEPQMQPATITTTKVKSQSNPAGFKTEIKAVPQPAPTTTTTPAIKTLQTSAPNTPQPQQASNTQPASDPGLSFGNASLTALPSGQPKQVPAAEPKLESATQPSAPTATKKFERHPDEVLKRQALTISPTPKPASVPAPVPALPGWNREEKSLNTAQKPIPTAAPARLAQPATTDTELPKPLITQFPPPGGTQPASTQINLRELVLPRRVPRR